MAFLKICLIFIILQSVCLLLLLGGEKNSRFVSNRLFFY